jgi:hypothetical protein
METTHEQAETLALMAYATETGRDWVTDYAGGLVFADAERSAGGYWSVNVYYSATRPSTAPPAGPVLSSDGMALVKTYRVSLEGKVYTATSSGTDEEIPTEVSTSDDSSSWLSMALVAGAAIAVGAAVLYFLSKVLK